VAGVAVTQTDPQDLLLPHERPGRPFLITDANGVIIISNPKQYLFRSLVPLSDDKKEPLQNRLQLSDVVIKPLSTRPIESRDKIKLITFSEVVESGVAPLSRQYVLADAPIASFGWRAYLLWPVENLNVSLIQRLMITLLAVIITWLLTLYAVERWRHMKLLHEQAICDPLTQLYTRLYMLQSATQLLAAHDRQSIPGVSAILFDLDRFKSINDRYGHSAGDNVLVQVAGVVKKECRDSDIPIRYGGEEILVFAPTGDPQRALQLAERIRLQIKNLRMRLSGKPVHITVSGGIAIHSAGESLEKLIARADQMMYQAKQNGRDQIKFDPSESA
jgi:diguanylate cyclase (GGDEF)-like protein